MDLTARYDDLIERLDALYEAQKFDEALRLLDTDSAGLEAWTAELSHLKACVQGLSGDTDGALRTLQAASAAGAWWEPGLLTDDDDLAGLRGKPEFDELVAVSAARVAPETVPPLIDVPDQTPVGVVVALHGAGQTAEHAQKNWRGVLDHGYALVCVQSSQLTSSNYRTWPDPDEAAADVARALAALPPELTAAHLPLIAAGFSAGGRAALNWALTAEPTPVAGVLAMAPAIRQLPDASAGKLSPATIWIGADDDLRQVVEGVAEKLESFGCTIERIPGLTHTFPADFDDRLRGLAGQL
ncbi:serine aminopeptidase domain-containing protein [Kribbella sp. CA-245084]|uniref:serine aminopeptidase domain-containing protein n=1 Tax=Kribbella sp. CA-245084 TaxID=3239940 RepID=UPI003D8D0FC4